MRILLSFFVIYTFALISLAAERHWTLYSIVIDGLGGLGNAGREEGEGLTFEGF